MKVLVDTDVVVDVGQARQPFVKASATFLNLLQSNVVRGFLSWHSAANIYYLLRPKIGHDIPLEFIADISAFLQIVPTNSHDLKTALVTPMRDFEDAMQVAAAVSCGADYIVTRNFKDFKNSPVQAISPAKAVELLGEMLNGE